MDIDYKFRRNRPATKKTPKLTASASDTFDHDVNHRGFLSFCLPSCFRLDEPDASAAVVRIDELDASLFEGRADGIDRWFRHYAAAPFKIHNRGKAKSGCFRKAYLIEANNGAGGFALLWRHFNNFCWHRI
jgi:hypothetical protein